MTRTHRLYIIIFLLLFAASSLTPVPASAQNAPATGTPAFGSFAGGPDVINLGNNNAHWDIPVLAKAGRGGLNFTYDLINDTSVWYPVNTGSAVTWTPVFNWGWKGEVSGTSVVGYISWNETNWQCFTYNGAQVFYYQFTNFLYYDAWGRNHPLPGQITSENPNVPPTSIESCIGHSLPPPASSFSISGTAPDGSGLQYSLSTTTQTASYITSGTIWTPDGKALNPPLGGAAGSGNITDRNGNQITDNGTGNFYDTLSSSSSVLTVAGSGTPTSPITFTYDAPSGANASYTMKFTTYSIQTNFGCTNPSISDYGTNGTTTANLVSEIDLADGSKYTFGYEPTPGHSGFVTGRIASVTVPTGGKISYTYTGSNNGIVCADGSTAGLQRSTPDTGSNYWSYSRSQASGHWQTTVTDPANNQTLIDFQEDSASPSTNNFYETQRRVYQGSTGGTPLRQWITCYNGNTSNCTTTAVSSPISQRNVTDQYGSSGLLCQHNYWYNSVGGLTEQDDYDYGSGGPGALLRKTLTTYAPLGNITAFRQTVTVCNGTGSSSSCKGTSGSSTGTVVA